MTQVSEMYETTLSALKDEGNDRMWFNTYVKLAKVNVSYVGSPVLSVRLSIARKEHIM